MNVLMFQLDGKIPNIALMLWKEAGYRPENLNEPSRNLDMHSAAVHNHDQ